METNRLFKGLDKGQLAEIDGLFMPQRFQAGACLIHEGAPLDRMFLLETGSVSLNRRRLAAQTSIERLFPGSFFGETAVLDGQPAPYEVVAASDVAVRTITQTDLLRLLTRADAVSHRLLLNLVGVLVERMRSVDERMAIMAGSVEMLRRYGSN